MYRILKADKDSYVTNKKIYSSRMGLTSSTDANVGQAGTLDLFKLYNEGGNTGIEISRGVIHFNLDPLRQLTGSFLDINDPSFKCYVNMKDVYGGQTVPSNFSLILYPLAKQFTEGRGGDVIAYRDLDAVNWFTSSIDSGVVTTWTSGGIEYGGASNLPNLDYYTFLSTSSGLVNLGMSQSFSRGDENLLIDVTTTISATLAGLLPDYGFRLSYSGSQETDSVTRFVKRFSTRQSRNSNLHPNLVTKYNDVFLDNQESAFFDYPNKIGLYYLPNGTATNFISGSTTLSGSGSVLLELIASKSVYVQTSSYSTTRLATVTYTSASWNYFSQSFTGSQISFGDFYQSGCYYADVNISLTATGLSGVLDQNNAVEFTSKWKSSDGNKILTNGPDIFFQTLNGTNTSVPQRNYSLNITNLKDVYSNRDSTKLRVFVYDFDPTITSFYLPYSAKPKIFSNMHWSIVDPYSKEVIIPFDTVENSTQLSSDGQGMYFTLYPEDLPINKPLEIKLLIKEYNSSYLIEDQGFIFKVTDL